MRNVVGAVVIVGPNESGNAGAAPDAGSLRIRNGSLACVEVLGQTVLGRTIEQLLRGGVDSVAVVANDSFASAVLGEERVTFSSAPDVWQSASEKIASIPAEAVLVMRLGGYVEFDAADLLQSHRDQRMSATRACTDAGPLDLWVIDPATMSATEDLTQVLRDDKAASYFVSGYVNALESPHDLRQLICDGFGTRCQFRPHGLEVKPGVWMGQGAQLERSSRIVAPAFIGRNCKIGDQCLITRGSNIESNSEVDYGTVVEDSSVLSNTYVGIGLDLSHSIVDGDNLMNLQHEVMLKISDPVVLRHVSASKVRPAKDGSFLAHLGISDMAMSSLPEERQ